MKMAYPNSECRTEECRSWRRLPLLAALLVVLAALSGGTPVSAADCVDTDGDDYVTCDSCTAPSGTQCGDCVEGNASVNPGAAEVCGDAIDNDCNGNIDFDRGAACSVADGLCLTNGSKQCLPDGSGTFCQLSGPLKVSSPEGPAGAASCFDAKDNDCDGLTDHAETECRTTEFCNGFDDDFDSVVDDGLGLGASCTVGVGACVRTGVTICASGGGTQCSVTAGAPSVEGPAGAFRCGDSVDNDCDGATDLADTTCQTAEVCDGLDNDGDGTADEDFADLGQACSKGVGACEASGIKVCRADGAGTTCNAPTVLGSPEGPAGTTCVDTVDNDCDGTVDAGDPGCGSAGLRVVCSLPQVHDDDDDHHFAATYRGGSGGRETDSDHDDDDDGVSCSGKHKILYSALNAGPNAVIAAELFALDKLGNIALDKRGRPLPVLPVHNGEVAHLKSRIKGHFSASTRTYDDDDDDDDGHHPPKPPTHSVTAPVPLLRVTVQDGGRQSQAFCSIIPYMQVFQPDGAVVSESEGDVTNFVAGIPLVDPASLVLRIDGVDVGQALGVNPATCTPDAPCSGSVLIGGHNVGITDLAVESATSTKYPSSNSVTMTVKDLGCGGHRFVLDGERTPKLRKTKYASSCHKDDILDNRASSGFGIEITSPGPGEVTDLVPTPVIGKACHGRTIASLDINGLAVDLSGQTFTPGDGLTTAGTYTVLFDVDVPQTDLVADLAGLNTALGTFDRGSNRLVAGATDDLANRTFDTRIFAVAGAGELTTAGVSLAARGPDILGITREAVADTLIEALATTDIPNAFVLGISGPALNTFFQATCNAATALVQQKINDKLAAHQFPSKSVSVPLACDPTVNTSVASVSINGNLTCNVTLQPAENKLTVHVALPPVAVNASAHGYCIDEIDLGFLGSICISEVIVNGSATINMSGMSVSFAVPETLLKDGGNVVGSFTPGTVSVQGTGGGVDVNCLSGVLYDIGTFFSELFGGPDLTPSFEGVFHEVDLTEKIGVKEFEIAIKQVKVNEQEVAAKDKLLTATLDTVDVQAGGLQMSIKASFSSTSTDPEVEETPGALLSPAPPPAPGAVPGAGNTFFVVADDAFNQLFASMTTQGEFRTVCKPSGQTIAELAPDDCTTLGNPITRGACQGLKGTVCSTLPLGERPSCNLVRNKMTQFNLGSDMPFLFCGRLDVPPQLLVQDDPGTEGVETHLRLNDLLASVVLDRDRDGVLGGELPSLAKCIQAGTDTSGDCRLLGACLDLNLETSLVLDQTNGKLKLIPAVEGVQLVPRPAGVACEGGINFGDLEFLQDASASDPLQDLMDNVDTLTPPLQSEGLDLGGIVLFSNPRLIAIETGGSVSFQDYIGVTGDIVPKP